MAISARLERDDVHAIVQATPDHWHTLINIAAAKAKKDVYREKPLTLTIDEGKYVIKAARENKIVFQTGTQQRSSKRFRLACELVHNGRLGRLKLKPTSTSPVKCALLTAMILPARREQ